MSRSVLGLGLVLILLPGCAFMGRRVYGVWLDPSWQPKVKSVALVAAQYERPAEVKAPGEEDSQGLSLGYSGKEETSYIAYKDKQKREGLSLSAMQAGERRVRETKSFQIAASPEGELWLPPPKSEKMIENLPSQLLSVLNRSKADGYLFFWGDVREAWLGTQVGEFWSILYSRTGKPLWYRKLDYRSQTQMTPVGGGVSVGVDLAWTKVADMMGYGNTRALEWSIGKKKEGEKEENP